MPETPPPGIFPLFLRGVTCEKFGFKNGEGLNDLVGHVSLSKDDISKEIQNFGVMSDFEPAKKYIDAYTGEYLLFVVDRTQRYGEQFLLCYTEDAKNEFLKSITEQEEALKLQREEASRAEEEKKAADLARLSVVFEDKPVIARPWISVNNLDTESEIKVLNPTTARELISVEITRPKRHTKMPYKFSDRNSDVGGIAEFRGYKDPNFKAIKESDLGIQVAATCCDSDVQTTWYRLVNKAVQYESAMIGTELSDKDNLLTFLEKATISIESALQQNESVDIFNETFRIIGDDDAQEGTQAENEMRELKNFADPNYSKFKVLAAIDWMPKSQGMVAVSAVRNISFDQRVSISGQTNTSYILLWDFRLLVKPLILMQAQHEIFAFRFNKTNNGLVAGGCVTGQVVLWDINDAVQSALHKNNRGSSKMTDATNSANEEDSNILPIQPKYISNVDHSHRKGVADLFWLPPNTQINHRGQLVGEEHLDGQSYQFVTVAGDGLVMVWDIRYEKISADELRHIGRSKHVPTEKSSNKEGGQFKPMWAPIFRAHLKRLEGVGELSLCKICEIAGKKQTTSTHMGKPTTFPGDSRSQFLIGTEEGDIIFTDLSSTRSTTTNAKGEDEEEDDAETAREYVKWIAVDHPRPCVSLQESPFFPQIYLSVSDWNFNIWKLGEDQPLFVSPLSTTYLTSGAWSTTRPSVAFVATKDGLIHVWDFTDSSFKPSIELKATHSKITSMEFLNSSVNTVTTTAAVEKTAATVGTANVPNASNSSSNKYQLLAVGDEDGTLHIFELPRNLTKPVHKEESIMMKFIDRELQRIEFSKSFHSKVATTINDDSMMFGNGGNRVNEMGRTNSNDDGLKLDKQAQSKEDDDYLKLESIFISELGLGMEQLPTFVKQGSFRDVANTSSNTK